MAEGSRKRIGVITADPENIYQSKIIEGVSEKAAQMNYDVLVFTTFVKANHGEGLDIEDRYTYLQGELNIYNIINFDKLDGVIVLTQTFANCYDNMIFNQIEKLLREKCHCPVITVDEDMGDYEKVITEDAQSFEMITGHVIEEHNCHDIIMLAGAKGTLASKMRVQGFRNALEAHGIEVKEDNFVYGPFWTTLGEQAAEMIADGRLHKPEAVVAASDYIGLGFVNRAVELGIKIPEDIIVTGFDGVIESRANEISLTSYIPSIAETGEKAVVKLAGMIEKREIKFEHRFTGKLVCGMSCGCRLTNVGRRDRDDFGYIAPTGDKIDMGRFLQSYMTETLTAAKNMDSLMDQILRHAYLVDNCMEYFLCTCENWQDIGDDLFGSSVGYTDQVKISVYRGIPECFDEWTPIEGRYDPYRDIWFDSSEMLPKIFETKREVPAVFYFTPVHFNGRRIGYAVMRFAPESSSINFIYQQWSRNVNNALEMMRVRELLVAKSTRDNMTGLYNRNSLESHISEQFDYSQKNRTQMYVTFVDMNCLKHINDVYGHDEGDLAICTLARVIASVYINNSVCIRMGGDEFLIIGECADPESEINARSEDISRKLEKFNSTSGKPFMISASFGSCWRKVSSISEVDDMIREADENMYQYKINYKKTHNIDRENR